MKLEPVRLPDWVARLNALLAARAATPFAWGEHDCSLFGADVVAAITGVDYGAPFRGGYTDARGAAAALRAHGQGTIVRTFDYHLRRVQKAVAQRGDLALHANSVGAVIGGGQALFVGEEGVRAGLVRVPRAQWTICWRVGR